MNWESPLELQVTGRPEPMLESEMPRESEMPPEWALLQQWERPRELAALAVSELRLQPVPGAALEKRQALASPWG